jgi:hypothetical protein
MNNITVITLYEVASNATWQLVLNMTSTTVDMYLFQAHWGLYDGPTSGISAIYNDDITVIDISGQQAISTSTAVPEFSLVLVASLIPLVIAGVLLHRKRQSIMDNRH